MAAKLYKVQVYLVTGASFVHPEGTDCLSKTDALRHAGKFNQQANVEKCEVLQSVQVVNK